MKDGWAIKIFCGLSLLMAGWASVSMFGWGNFLPYPLAGWLAVVFSGVGLIKWLRMRSKIEPYVNSPREKEFTNKHGTMPGAIYVVMAVLGLIAGLFWGSMIGPLILFFPKI